MFFFVLRRFFFLPLYTTSVFASSAFFVFCLFCCCCFSRSSQPLAIPHLQTPPTSKHPYLSGSFLCHTTSVITSFVTSGSSYVTACVVLVLYDSEYQHDRVLPTKCPKYDRHHKSRQRFFGFLLILLLFFSSLWKLNICHYFG